MSPAKPVTASLIHELNNLLTAVLGNAELALLQTPPTSPAYHCLDQIHQSATRAAQLLASPVQQPVEPETILIIDGDEDVLEASRGLLEHAGYQVLLAGSRTQAFDRLPPGRTLAAVLLSATLPDGDGADILRQLRSAQPNLRAFVWGVPSQDAEVRDRFKSVEPVDFLDKPSHLPGLANLFAGILEALKSNG